MKEKKKKKKIALLLLQFQMIAYLGLGIPIVAPLSEPPDPAIKSQPLGKQLWSYTKSQLLNQKTELCPSPNSQPNEPLVILLLLRAQPNWSFHMTGNFPSTARTLANIPHGLPHSGNKSL